MSISPSSPLKERYSDAKEKLLQIPGVVSVSLGFKEKEKNLTDQFCLRVYVQQKRDPGDVPAQEMIPSEINGLTTDVLQAFETGLLSKGGTRPLVGGLQLSQYYSVEHAGTGTLGCIAKRSTGTQRVALSNQHVLEANGTLAEPETGEGHNARQPKRNDSCGIYYENIIGGIRYGMMENVGVEYDEASWPVWVDAAVAYINNDVEKANRVEEIGVLNGSEDLFHYVTETLPSGYAVRKRGFKTQLTHGIVVEVNYLSTMIGPAFTPIKAYNVILVHPVAPFKEMTETFEVPAAEKAGILQHFSANEPFVTVTENGNRLTFVTRTFCQSGDSGSVLVNSAGKVVGLLFGVSTHSIRVMIDGNEESHAINTGRGTICHIGPVLREMDIVIESGVVESAGAAIDVEEVALARAEMAPDLKDAMAIAEADISSFPLGRQLIDIVKRHAAEVIQLVHHYRPVKVIWHRNKCPAFSVSLINMVRDHRESLHRHLGDISITTAAQRLWDAFIEHGSPALQDTLQEYGHHILQMLSECNTYDDMIHFLKKEIWTGYTTSKQ